MNKNNPIIPWGVTALVLLAVVQMIGAQQCQPDKITQLLKEIMVCQGGQQQPSASPQPQGPPGQQPQNPLVPNIPQGAAKPPTAGSPPPRLGYPGAPSGGSGFPGFPTFLSSPPQRGGGGMGVLVSRPIPADVQPVQGDGLPSDTQFFVAGPRSRPSNGGFPSFGGSGGDQGFPFSLNPFARREPPQKPGQNPGGAGQGPPTTDDMDFPLSSLFPNYGSSFGGFGGSSQSPDIDPRFGGPPSFGNPFGSGFPGAPGGGNTLTFEISPSGAGGPGGGNNPLGIDFDEILKILKELQGKDGTGPDEKEKQPPSNPDLDSNTTEGIIDVDTTMSPTTAESMTESTPDDTTTEMPTEK